MDIQFKTTSASSLTELFIDGEWKGTFMSQRKAQVFVEGLSKSDRVVDETTRPGLVSQKNDEVKKKRRGRPRKADNDRRKLPSVRSASSEAY